MVARTLALHALILALALAVTGCGSDDETASDDERPDAPAIATHTRDGEDGDGSEDGSGDEQGEEPAPGPAESAAARVGVATFADTPELRACMHAGGFTDAPPPTGAAKAWSHADGARVVVAAGEREADLLADELAAGGPRAKVRDNVVFAGAGAHIARAMGCLS